MQTGLSAADRKIMWIAGGLLAAITFATVVTTPSVEISASTAPSSYLQTPGGARAAFVLLQHLGVNIERWQEPPLRLVEFARGATLIMAEPAETPSRAERAALKQFVQNGGRLLFCGDELPSFFPQIQLRKLPGQAPAAFEKAGLAALPMRQYRPIEGVARDDQSPQSIELRTGAVWQKLSDSQLPVYGVLQESVVVVWAMGAGEIIWWAAATPLTNSGLERVGNLPLFLNSVGVQAGRRVYWDEYFHGERGSLWDYAGRTPIVRWGALQFAVLAFASLFTFSRRSGPVIAQAVVSRLSPLEFVETLGGLYGRARAAPVPVDVTFRQLRLQLMHRLALPLTIPDADLARAASERLGWDEGEVNALFEQARGARTVNSVSGPAALKLVQALQGFTARLAEPGTKRSQPEKY